MSQPEEAIKILERTTVPRLLLILYHKGSSTRLELKTSIEANPRTIRNGISLLVNEGLATEKEGEEHGRIYTSLTNRGEAVAKNLNEILGLIA